MTAPTNPHLIDARDVSKLISLFDRLYKLGVEDALQFLHDEGMCREHISVTSTPGKFGLLRDGFISDEIDWQLTIQQQAKVMGVYAPIRRMLTRMGAWAKSNYFSCILPLAQDFYNLGIKDALKKPSGDSFDSFSELRRRRWGQRSALDNYAYVELIQLFCGNRMRCEADVIESLAEMGEPTPEQRSEVYRLRRSVLKTRWWQNFRRVVAIINAPK